MDCKEAERLVQPYIDNKIPPKKLEAVIAHVSGCPSCYDELETYYTIYFAMKYLDEDRHTSYNIRKMLDEDLKKRAQYVKRCRRRRMASIVAAVVLTILLVICIVFLFMPEMQMEAAVFFSDMLHL